MFYYKIQVRRFRSSRRSRHPQTARSSFLWFKCVNPSHQVCFELLLSWSSQPKRHAPPLHPCSLLLLPILVLHVLLLVSFFHAYFTPPTFLVSSSSFNSKTHFPSPLSASTKLQSMFRAKPQRGLAWLRLVFWGGAKSWKVLKQVLYIGFCVVLQ